ncbi:hypothetical protein N9N08_00665 [bacterium]|jgi:hypothetical protein|nr:hypothetical protein [bacterium]
MHIKMSMNIVQKELDNGVTIIYHEDFNNYRLYKDLPKGDYVIIDFGSVWEHNFLFFAMKSITLAKEISRNVIMTYPTEAFHSKFWEFTCQFLEDQNFNRAMIIDAGINLGFEGYVNIGQRLKVVHVPASQWFDYYTDIEPDNNLNMQEFKGNRSKHFISLARFARSERIEFTNKILDSFLRYKGRFSCGWGDTIDNPMIWHKDSAVWSLIPHHLHKYYPITLGDDLDDQHKLQDHITDNVINVVLEAETGHNPACYKIQSDIRPNWEKTAGRFLTVYSDRIMATEKTTKVFAMNQIPIFLGPPALVFTLNHLGFDMFEDLVDHSYDKKDSLETRIDLLSEELKRLCSKPLSELNNYLEENKDRLKANQDHCKVLGNRLHDRAISYTKEFIINGNLEFRQL